MGSGRDWPELRRWPGDNFERSRKDARRYEKEVSCSTKCRLAQGRPGSTVLHVLSGIHVEVCQAVHTIRGEVYWRLLWHYSVPYQTNLRRGSCCISAGAETSVLLGRPGSDHRNHTAGYKDHSARGPFKMVPKNRSGRICNFRRGVAAKGS